MPLQLKILILGAGGRAHTFCWKIRQSELCAQLFIAPGNAGTSEYGENIDISVTDFDAIKKICTDKHIDLVVVGPEEPLVKGIYDYFKSDRQLQHIMITGPSAAGAQLEGSKAFAKAFMLRHQVPTAEYREFGVASYDEGVEFISRHALPIVLKADGLAGGKGVVICQNHQEALAEFELMIQQSKFGEAGHKVVVEQFLDGIELSVFVLTDGKDYLLLPEAKDYKKIGEGDKGPNTGGMGAVSPVPFAKGDFMQKVIDRVIEPTIKGLRDEKIDYRGFLFFGLIKVQEEPYVIEYNCRMGDPETEVVLLRMKSDLVPLLIASDQQKLKGLTIEIDPLCAATIVAVSKGYPMAYKNGHPVDFAYLRQPGASKPLDISGGTVVFHAGTIQKEGAVLTNGGRVLAVSSLARSLPEALSRSLQILDQIHFEGMTFRKDIGYEFMEPL